MAGKEKPDNKTNSFEQSLSKLEKMVDEMEHGELSLEKSLKAFEEGVKLTREAQKSLDQAQQRIHLLTEVDGEPTADDFNETGDS